MSKTRYKIRKEQLERVVESFVMESAKGGSMIDKNAAKKHKMSMGAEQQDDMGEGMEKAKEVKKAKMSQAPEVKKHMKSKMSEARLAKIKQIMETYDITEEELEEGLFSKTAEELMAKGQKIMSSDQKAKAIYNTIKKDEGNYGENAANKYLMFIAKSNGKMLYASWDKGLEAPDKTMGFWIERGKARSGWDKSTGSGTEL
jgi:hypothetical protein